MEFWYGCDARYFKTYPIHIHDIRKKGPIHIVQNFDLLTRVLLVLMLHTHKYLLTLRLSELCISAKRVLKHGCPNQFVVHILNMEKWGHSYTFTGKLKPIHITGDAISYMNLTAM